MMKNKNSTPNGKITLLDAFVMRKVLEHNEPERKGTPKGNPIGFSHKKYRAALMCLKKYPLKLIAETLQISHGLLRKWRTEKSFKELVGRLAIEYAEDIIVHIVTRGNRQKELADDYFSKSLEEITKKSPPELTWIEFNDLKQYSERLVAHIITISIPWLVALQKEIEDLPDNLTGEDLINVSIHHQLKSLGDILVEYPFRKNDRVPLLREIEGKQNELKQSFSRGVLGLINREWSENGTISEEALKKTVCTIHNLSDNFMPVDMEWDNFSHKE